MQILFKAPKSYAIVDLNTVCKVDEPVWKTSCPEIEELQYSTSSQLIDALKKLFGVEIAKRAGNDVLVSALRTVWQGGTFTQEVSEVVKELTSQQIVDKLKNVYGCTHCINEAGRKIVVSTRLGKETLLELLAEYRLGQRAARAVEDVVAVARAGAGVVNVVACPRGVLRCAEGLDSLEGERVERKERRGRE